MSKLKFPYFLSYKLRFAPDLYGEEKIVNSYVEIGGETFGTSERDFVELKEMVLEGLDKHLKGEDRLVTKIKIMDLYGNVGLEEP